MHDAKRRPAARRATPEKLKRDAKNLKEYARFVIVLGESGIEVIDNGARRALGLPYVRIIAVLAPSNMVANISRKAIFWKSAIHERGRMRARNYRKTVAVRIGTVGS